MKTKEELATLKKEIQEVSKKLAELTEDELEQVTGGVGLAPSMKDPGVGLPGIEEPSVSFPGIEDPGGSYTSVTTYTTTTSSN